jgi:hypothetical protein
MEKLNIAELIKDCPSGMELNCLMYEDVYFDYVDEFNNIHCYIQHKTYKTSLEFSQHGTTNNDIKSKCVIFPKGKNTWNGFQRPFKDGDVVVAEDAESFQLFLLKHLTHSKNDNNYDGYCYFGWDFQCNGLFEKGNWGFNRLATEKEKKKLFNVIKENGYKWNHKTKTLEKLPKFKVDNKIKLKGEDEIGYVTQVTDCYFTIKCKNNTHCWPIERQDDWELVPNKFDITTLKPFESRVLVRDYYHQCWKVSFFGYFDKFIGKFDTVRGVYIQCIPYEGNEHLLGKTDDCDEYFKNWR